MKTGHVSRQFEAMIFLSRLHPPQYTERLSPAILILSNN
jgi:hypothetical protein